MTFRLDKCFLKVTLMFSTYCDDLDVFEVLPKGESYVVVSSALEHRLQTQQVQFKPDDDPTNTSRTRMVLDSGRFLWVDLHLLCFNFWGLNSWLS